MAHKYAVKVDLRENLANPRAETQNPPNPDNIRLGRHSSANHLLDTISAVDLPTLNKSAAPSNPEENG